MEKKIGFIGQGFIGKNYADDFESRGYEVIRYSLDDVYIENESAIATCDIVFIAVPTPTTEDGFDSSILEGVVSLTGPNSIVVLKSTSSPGLTQKIQEAHPEKIILFSPEFLREATAAEDAKNPTRNIIGIPKDTKKHMDAAIEVMSILPTAPYEKIVDSLSAEYLKYVSNTLPYVKIVFLNLVYDLFKKHGGDWSSLKELLEHDPYIAPRHLDPVHKTGRGAGGHCLIKDFAAFREFYEKEIGDSEGVAFLKAAEMKNTKLLVDSGKDIDLLKGVYGNI